jgi:hypothetical protein
VFHLDCIQRWLKTRSACPLCNKEWEFAKIERILAGARAWCGVGLLRLQCVSLHAQSACVSSSGDWYLGCVVNSRNLPAVVSV